MIVGNEDVCIRAIPNHQDDIPHIHPLSNPSFKIYLDYLTAIVFKVCILICLNLVLGIYS
jgi:hypothetical protein